MKCPICEKVLKPIKQSDGSTRYECDCSGQTRTVIHDFPATAPQPEPKEK